MTRPTASRAPDPEYRHVLVPLDGSDLADAAVGTARALAERFGAEVHAVSVVRNPTEGGELRDHAAAQLGVGPDDERIAILSGTEPATAIVQRADALGSCLICMSTHGRGRIAGSVMGSVARSVLQTGDRPIVAVGPNANRPPSFAPVTAVPLSANHLVACVDGREASEHVLPVATAWAHRLGLAMTILTVAEPTPPPTRPDAPWRRRHGPDEDADAYIAWVAARWRDQVDQLSSHVEYDPISPADGVRAYVEAHPTDLVAVTTSARRGLQRLILGAVAASIVHACPVPVLVVPLPA